MLELVRTTDQKTLALWAYVSAIYAQQAIYRATNPADAEAATAGEREWQYQHLRQLRKIYEVT